MPHHQQNQTGTIELNKILPKKIPFSGVNANGAY